MMSSPALSRDDVVAGAAEQEVVAVAAVDPVVAAVAPDGVVVGLAGDQPVVALGAAQHDGVAEEVVVADEVDGAVGESPRPAARRVCRSCRSQVDGRWRCVAGVDGIAVGVSEVVLASTVYSGVRKMLAAQMLGAGVVA